MREIRLVNEQIYHVYNRGTDKREIFLEKMDYLRCIHNLFEFNNSNPSSPSNIRFHIKTPKNVGVNEIKKSLDTECPNFSKPKRNLLVNILAFALMPNHFHLLLEQKQDDGVSKFLHKLSMGYSKYFNEKHKRSGVLFQGKFKAVPVEHNRQLLHLPYYIHLNPLDLKYPGWRKNDLPNYKKAMQFLETYRWSSYPDYIGKKNFPSVTQRDFLTKFLGGETQHKKDIQKWLKERERNLKIMGDTTLE